MTKRLLAIFFALFFLGNSAISLLAHGIETEIIITDTGYTPNEVTINVGESVVFVNRGENPHWPASNIHPTHEVYSEFDPLKPIASGGSWEFTFDRAGEWRFHDHIYPTMTGKITVVGDGTQKQVNETKEMQLPLFQRVKIFFAKIFYGIFPSRLSSVDMFEVAEVEEELEYWLLVLGPERTMQTLLDQAGGGSDIDCHRQAHFMGRSAYKLFGAEVFEKGDASCHSGFYHGAMEDLLRTEGTENLAQRISEICSTFTTSFGNFECLHGVGHGVMAYEDYDMPRSLEVCGGLSDAFEQSSCYGGVFMENVVAAQGRGAVEGHETAWVSSDPHFPCNGIDQAYDVQFQCYMMQTSRMLDLNGYNFNLLATQCLRAKGDMVHPCFVSMGRDAAGFTLRDPDKTIEICSLAPEENHYSCLSGGLNVIVDFWGEKITTQGDEFCNRVPQESTRRCQNELASRLEGVFGN